MAVFTQARSVLAACRAQGLGLVVVAVIAGCSPIYRNHGYVPAEDELAAVEVGVDTRETVGQKIGRPSTSGLSNNDGWFYVQSRYKLVGPREPQEVERQVLVVNFAENGTVSNIGRFGLEDGRVVELSRRVTETNIKGVSFIGQLLGSIGRIRAEDIAG
ncbi:MAG: outer membrane protein assembly factor BamE [Tabrizicola sp.]|uniref:outer membrane protein assembly factor BamE n=1 Tax=Tabrizicola sp. TaxID=2005166 RepID=UPI0027327903|nr:outer membrane protein assembly factor BamE [Tabrizicola sp.]MDP3263378.1 outer membrane protein assembly factor BamE [Tabrizicola sp.]MDP3646735.1 outer membrane protein assembly factor BamE [Paracoccaceae bacterium]MDZ4068141.1 outer membrane protein assembly factor BamE [Tabrizicola sp.]